MDPRPAPGGAPATATPCATGPADVLGAVVCGGKSARMGRDKGALELEGESLVLRAAKLLAALSGEVVLATGAEPRYAETGLAAVLDAPQHRGAGPAAGLAAALRHARSRGASWLVVLACDMPGATSEPFQRLLAEARHRDLDVCLFEHAGHPQPLLAVYHVRALGPLLRALAAGRVRMIDFHQGFGTLRVDALRLGDQEGDPGRAETWVRNVNTPDDWVSTSQRSSEAGSR